MSRRAGFRDSFAREIGFLRRSPWDLALLTWAPLLLCGLIAWELSGGVPRRLPVVVIDQDGSAAARALTSRLNGAPGLHVAARVPDLLSAEPLLRARDVYAAVLIPRGSARDALRGEARLLLFYNASYATAASAVRREVAAALDSTNASLAREQVAAVAPAGAVRPAPVAVFPTIVWNPGASYELQLVSLLHPALLHLLFMIAVVSAFGRELRDSTVAGWAPGVAGLLGKAAPYALAFTAWGMAATAYLAAGRGWAVQGSQLALLAGYGAMYAGYLGVALLLVGATRAMGQALSLTGLYAGASFAFAGAIFPLEQASGFARAWSAVLPYTAFARLVALEWIADAPAAAAVGPIARMLLIGGVAGAAGVALYLRAARDPAAWGRR